MSLPTGKKYNVIYADPPWRYNNHSSNGYAEKHYQTMTIKEIKALPIKDLAADPCALFMWSVFPCLPDCLDVMKAWGFKYKTLGFSWVKMNRDNGRPFFGLGNYTKANCEVCLMGVRGNVSKLVKRKDVSSCIISQIREHSRKPDIARERIVQLFGNVPRIELFARDNVPGWDQYGNQLPQMLPLV